MKTKNTYPIRRIFLLALLGAAFFATNTLAEGLPELGLILYGKVRNAGAGNALVTQGTLTLTVQQVGGASVVVSTPSPQPSPVRRERGTALPPGQSFRARVPSEFVAAEVTRLTLLNAECGVRNAEFRSEPRHRVCDNASNSLACL